MSDYQRLDTAGFRPFSSLVSSVLALSCLLVLSRTSLADEPDGGWRQAESRLKKAVIAQNATRANAAIDALAETGERRAHELIIKYGLRKPFALINRHAAGTLALLPPKKRDVVFDALEKSKYPVTKIILLAVVKRWAEDPAAMKALHGRLRDPQKAVVFSALRWIREIGDASASFPPLVRELERRERQSRGRVYYDIRETLKSLSGGHDYELAADWKNYWAARKANESFEPKKRKPGRTAVAKPPSFFSMSINSNRVVFIIDISHSMLVEDPYEKEPEGDEYEVIGDGTTVVRVKRKRTTSKGGDSADGRGDDGPEIILKSRIDAVKAELVHTIKGLDTSVKFNIFSFNHQFRIFDQSAGGGLLHATAANKKKAISWVQGLRANGATRTDVVLSEVLAMPEVDTIYLLTDGAPKTVRNEKIPPETVFSIVRQRNRFRKVRINTIGFYHAGTSMQRFVKQLAKRNEGRCVLLK